MPQLDKLSFITQIFWVILVLCILYFSFFKFILPLISSTIKYRVKFLSILSLQQTWYLTLLNNSWVLYVSLFNFILDNFIFIGNFYKLLYVVYFNSLVDQKANEISFK